MTKPRTAREIYKNYIRRMNDESTNRELIAYQDYGECFAIIGLTTYWEGGDWTDYIVTMIDFYCNVKPIRTYSHFNEALAAFTALAYKSKPIISLPF